MLTSNLIFPPNYFLGPFMPGCMDIVLDYNKEAPFIRLFYPTNAKKDAKENFKKFLPWIQDDSYLIGISKVLMLHIYLMRLLFWWTDRVHIPAVYGEKARTDEKLKCIIMSHGLGGNRFLYSNVCCEMASNGFLVAALEHRDLSSCNTYYYASQEDAKKDNRSTLDFRHIQFGENHYTERNTQIKIRFNECCKVVDFLINLNKGIVAHNVMTDVPTKHEINFNLEDLMKNLDIDCLTMMGHSFGAATALYTISKRKELKQCILLDPWMFPIKNERLEDSIEQPLLFINTQTFHIESNVKAMSKFLANDDRKMYTILHTTHENQSDSVLLIGYWLNWFMRKLNPLVALRINNALILKFVNQYTNYPSNIEVYNNYLEKQKQNIEFGLTKPWA
ncbi:hypothetical protein NQ314_012388 [Rhamnusium bicolor]|uniref:1-alkyl-2-acetylglycerophosphocholine esterase n=1 Tax=Rhamnusium bicolor TaxID=1586634 RepID=A0AAV8XCN0_9CUCU|nr:hypothetical protein NQ314_012388 [Rhamnusium bicolor]